MEAKIDSRSLVNRLVQQSFGAEFRGDWASYDGCNWVGHNLDIIGRRRFTLLPFLGKDFIRAGEFELKKIGGRIERDGSSLRVHQDYIEQAKKYAELYEKETGKKVSITCYTD